jgi:hypothetical protein
LSGVHLVYGLFLNPGMSHISLLDAEKWLKLNGNGVSVNELGIGAVAQP